MANRPYLGNESLYLPFLEVNVCYLTISLRSELNELIAGLLQVLVRRSVCREANDGGYSARA